MKTKLRAVWLLVAMGGGVPLAVSARQAAARANEARVAKAELVRVVELVQEERRLRAELPERKASASASLQARISGVLRGCGLPSGALSGLTPEPETSGRDVASTVKRRKAVLVLQGATLAEVGRFLKAWRETEPGWVVSNVEITPSGHAPGGGDLPLRAAIGMESAELTDAIRDLK